VSSRRPTPSCATDAGGEDELRERPIVHGGGCPMSPLKLPRDATEVIIESARWWIPDNILSMATAGGSSRVTLAGTLVTHSAACAQIARRYLLPSFVAGL